LPDAATQTGPGHGRFGKFARARNGLQGIAQNFGNLRRARLPRHARFTGSQTSASAVMAAIAIFGMAQKPGKR
jgi:hypothetical protein